MDKTILSPEKIIGKLREADVLLGQGSTMKEVIGRLAISEQTYKHWREEYGRMWFTPVG
jgi:transposase